MKHKWIFFYSARDCDAFGHPVGTTAKGTVSSDSQIKLVPGPFILKQWLAKASEDQIETLYDVLCREDDGEVAAKLGEVQEQLKQWFPPTM